MKKEIKFDMVYRFIEDEFLMSSITHRFIFSLIINFNKNGDIFYPSNKTISEITGFSKRNVSRVMNTLLDKKYIKEIGVTSSGTKKYIILKHFEYLEEKGIELIKEHAPELIEEDYFLTDDLPKQDEVQEVKKDDYYPTGIFGRQSRGRNKKKKEVEIPLSPEEVELEKEFDKLRYEFPTTRKGGKAKCFKLFKELSRSERNKAIKNYQRYKESLNDIKWHVGLEKYLSEHTFKDYDTNSTSRNKGTTHNFSMDYESDFID